MFKQRGKESADCNCNTRIEYETDCNGNKDFGIIVFDVCGKKTKLHAKPLSVCYKPCAAQCETPGKEAREQLYNDGAETLTVEGFEAGCDSVFGAIATLSLAPFENKSLYESYVALMNFLERFD